jgi:MFS transporter, DHA1 family, tetracycline resistance protein
MMKNPDLPPPTTEPRTGSLIVIFLTVFIDLLGFGMVLPLLPIYAQDFVVDEHGVLIGCLMASFSAMQFLWAPVWGRLSDRIGRRPVLMIGLAGSCVFYTLFGLATVWRSMFWLFVARIGAGIAGANIPITQAYIADTTTVENRVKGMTLIGAAFGLGFTFGPLLGSLAVPGETGAPGPWPGYVAAMLSAIALLTAYFVLPESLKPGSTSAARRLFDMKALRDAVATPSIGPLLLTLFILVLAFANYETTLALLLRGDKSAPDSPYLFSFQQVLYTFAFIGITLSIAQGVLVRRLSGKIPEPVMAAGGAVGEIIGFGVMIVAVGTGNRWQLFAALSLIVVGFAFMMPSLTALISRRSSPERQGGILGLSQSVSALARILGPMMGVPLLKHGLRLPYTVAACTMGLGLFMIILSARRGKDYAAPPAAALESFEAH